MGRAANQRATGNRQTETAPGANSDGVQGRRRRSGFLVDLVAQLGRRQVFGNYRGTAGVGLRPSHSQSPDKVSTTTEISLIMIGQFFDECLYISVISACPGSTTPRCSAGDRTRNGADGSGRGTEGRKRIF